MNDAQVLREAALGGYGIILQAEVVVAVDLALGRLVAELPGYVAPSRPIHLLFQASRQRSPKLRSFIRTVVEAFDPADIEPVAGVQS